MKTLPSGLRPLSSADLGLGMVTAAFIITVWFAGDFHGLHDSDSLIHSLNSLYQWTPFVWEYDHIGSLISLLASLVNRPYWNVFAISTISSILFLTGLALWGSLIWPITLAESSLWVALLLPIMFTQHAIFQLASHSIASGAALFFSAWYVYALLHCMRGSNSQILIPMLFGLAFLAIYISKLAFFSLAAVTSGVLWNSHPLSWRRIITIGACLTLALLCYQVIEQASPFRKDYTLQLDILPIGLPSLLENWGRNAMTGVAWLAAPPLMLLLRPARQNSVFPFLAAGILIQTLIISGSRWAALNSFAAHYLFDLSFLSLLAVMGLGVILKQRWPSVRMQLGVLVGLGAFFLNIYAWRAYQPADPLRRMEQRLGPNTPAFVAADCDLIVGDYWTAWPAMLAVNDYYYRNHILDSQTNQARKVYAITSLASSTKNIWQPILDRSDTRLCSLAGNDGGYKQSLSFYAPEIALQTLPIAQTEAVVVHQIHRSSMHSVALDFDQLVPGIGWSYGEATPNGETFQWMDTTNATIFLPLAMDRDLWIEFRVLYTMSPEILDSLTISVNGQFVALSQLPDTRGDLIFSARIPTAVIMASPGLAILTLHISRTIIPHFAFTNSDDMRSLGLAFDWLRIEAQP